jgi:hypothetical protein
MLVQYSFTLNMENKAIKGWKVIILEFCRRKYCNPVILSRVGAFNFHSYPLGTSPLHMNKNQILLFQMVALGNMPLFI